MNNQEIATDLATILSVERLDDASSLMDEICMHLSGEHELNQGQINFMEDDSVMATLSIEEINLYAKIIHFAVRDLSSVPRPDVLVSFNSDTGSVVVDG